MAISLTLSQIVNLSGGDPRRMKQFANDQIFLPTTEERASRAARRYSISESAIACIVARLDAFRVKPATLASLAENLRSIYAVQLEYDFKNRHEAQRFWSREVLLGMYPNQNDLPDPQKRKELALLNGLDTWPAGKMRGIEASEMSRIKNWLSFEAAREGERLQMFLNVAEDGHWNYWLSAPPTAEERDVYIVLNLHRILSVLK